MVSTTTTEQERAAYIAGDVATARQIVRIPVTRNP